MKTPALCAALALFAFSQTEAQPMTSTPPGPAPIFFFNIAGPDRRQAEAFYATNFGWSIDAANGIKTPKLGRDPAPGSARDPDLSRRAGH